MEKIFWGRSDDESCVEENEVRQNYGFHSYCIMPATGMHGQLTLVPGRTLKYIIL